jgi:hypothetical protein
MKYYPLAVVALVLAAVAAIGWYGPASYADQTPALIAILAMMILLALPGMVFRMMGGSGLVTWLICFLVPFGFFEIQLAIAAHRNAELYIGGDLQGIETVLMWVCGILILFISTIVALIAIGRYPLEPRD